MLWKYFWGWGGTAAAVVKVVVSSECRVTPNEVELSVRVVSPECCFGSSAGIDVSMMIF